MLVIGWPAMNGPRVRGHGEDRDDAAERYDEQLVGWEDTDPEGRLTASAMRVVREESRPPANRLGP